MEVTTERSGHYCKKCGKHLGMFLNEKGVKIKRPFKCYMCALEENKDRKK